MSHMNAPISSVAGLDLPKLEPTHRLNRILSATLCRKPSSQQPVKFDVPPWSADCFGIAYSPTYNDCSNDEQTQILQLASGALLTESYAIEKAGVGYMAKMALLAETTEERMLYSLFGADETTHLSQLMPFVSHIESANKQDPFLQLLESLLETTDRSALLFVIQVVLEGWGLNHYRTLSKTCQDYALSSLFRSFVQAEARHHGAGVVLFETERLSEVSRTLILDTLAAFLRMVQVGPQKVVAAIAQVKGGLTKAQRIQLFSELDTEAHSEMRLKLLRSLILSAAPEIAYTLEEKGLFEPAPPALCV